MQTTLAYNMRPLSLKDVLGQEKLAGKNGILTQMVKKKHVLSMILYGPPGCGKTTLAKALAHDLDVPCRLFNASTGNKKELDNLITEARISDGLLVIIDEIHRLRKDIQDHLLPHVEDGLLTIIGCTTANPYHAINPAIRSRCAIFKVARLNEEEIALGLKKAAESSRGLNGEYQFDEEVYDYIARISAGDIRYAYNCLELAVINSDSSHITKEAVAAIIPRANLQYDKNEDQYYDTLSGLQKSIRGSDVNGALYYFAKLIAADDMESLTRRLLVIAYEEVGLANPNACARTFIALESAKAVGFPEARIPIAQVIIDLALSPKSRSSEAAIDAASASLDAHAYDAPEYLRLSPIGLSDEERYDYDMPEIWEYLQYLPDEISQQIFYHPSSTSRYERALAANDERIRKHGRTNNIVGLKRAVKKK